MKYSEHRYWSVMHDGRVARLSMADEFGAEHYAIVVTDSTRASPWRDRRDRALDAIAAHITTGEPAGEVRLAD